MVNLCPLFASGRRYLFDFVGQLVSPFSKFNQKDKRFTLLYEYKSDNRDYDHINTWITLAVQKLLNQNKTFSILIPPPLIQTQPNSWSLLLPTPFPTLPQICLDTFLVISYSIFYHSDHSLPLLVTCLSFTLTSRVYDCYLKYCIILDIQGDWSWQVYMSFAKILWQLFLSQLTIPT